MATHNDADNVGELLPVSLADRPRHISGSVALFGRGEDVDVVVQAPGRPLVFLQELIDAGWIYDAEYATDSEFLAVRRGAINVILVSPPRYATFLAGLAACKVLVDRGLLLQEYKQTRVNIFESIHDAASPGVL